MTNIMKKCGKCKLEKDEIEFNKNNMPLSRGGTHTLEDVRPSCAHCNLTKSNKLPEEFIKYKKEYK